MKTFKDMQSREWNISITVAVVKKVRDVFGTDLLDIHATFPRLLADPIFLVDLLYCLCKSQADTLGVTDEQFGEAMAGDVIGNAKRALIEELKSFFPTPEERDAVNREVRKGEEMLHLLREKGLIRMENLDLESEAEKILNLELEKIFGNSSTDSPESSESTPTP